MSESTLIQKIKADTDATVASIHAKAEADVAAIRKETTATLETIRATHAQELQKAIAHLELVTTSRAKQAANIALQRAKREEIDAVFSEVLQSISGADSAVYQAFFSKKLATLVPKNVTVTKVEGPASREAETKKILAEANIDAAIEAHAGISAGLILHATDGVYDITLKRLFDDNRNQFEMIAAEKIS